MPPVARLLAGREKRSTRTMTKKKKRKATRTMTKKNPSHATSAERRDAARDRRADQRRAHDRFTPAKPSGGDRRRGDRRGDRA